MPRVTFSNELNDFVKAFGVGAELVRQSKKNDIDQQEADDRKAYYNTLKEHYKREDDRLDGDKAAVGAIYNEGASKPAYMQPGAPTQIGSFNTAVNRTLGFEGGKGVDSNGAAVNMGVNAAANPDVDVNHLSRPQAEDIYRTRYWNAIDGNRLAEINPALAHVAFDTAVNSGPQKAKELIAQSGGDPMKLLDLREQFLHRLAASRPHEFGPGVQKAWAQRISALRKDIGGGVAVPVQSGACGGMIRKYEMGGVVDEDADPNDADDRPVYNHNYPDAVQPRTTAPASTPSGNFLDVLPDAVKAGLTGLQEMFGLRASAAPGGDQQTVAGARALMQGDGAAPPEQIAQVTQKVDPEGRLDESMRNIAGLSAVYEYYATKGDIKKAQSAAAQLLQANFIHTQKLGALAAAAIQSGEMGPATKAVLAAYNAIPNGKQASVQGDHVVVTDQRTGKPVEQFKLTPQILLQAATGLADGSAYHNQLMAVASGKPGAVEEEPDPAFERYAAGEPAPSAAVPAAREPEGPPMPEEESVEETFKPTTPRPNYGPEPAVPDIAHMTDKAHRVAASADYGAKMRDYSSRRTEAEKQYNEAVTLERKAFDDTHNAAKQRRHEEAGKIDDAYDAVVLARPEGSPEVPQAQQNDIKEAARGFVRTQDMSREQGIRVAMQVYDPKTNVTLKDLKGGGKITLDDGSSYKLDAETFKRVKKAREGFKKLTEEAKRPGAWETFKSAISF